jgi:NAD(P)-dependent dehydrogenase (short-subunit alcohol dehydrogenase family)
MDLGLDGRTAVVCASSQGLGRGCATELARADCTVVINGRDAAKLERTAEEIRQETGATVIPVAVDLDITSASVKQPLPGLDLSSGARAGLTGFLAGVARIVAHANVTINFLLPGSFATPRMQSIQEGAAQQQGVSAEVVAEHVRASIPAKRFGTPAEFGAACAFLCAAGSGFITGQSLLIDGGAYPGIL